MALDPLWSEILVQFRNLCMKGGLLINLDALLIDGQVALPFNAITACLLYPVDAPTAGGQYVDHVIGPKGLQEGSDGNECPTNRCDCWAVARNDDAGAPKGRYRYIPWRNPRHGGQRRLPSPAHSPGSSLSTVGRSTELGVLPMKISVASSTTHGANR